jgi:hypothetical protein
VMEWILRRARDGLSIYLQNGCITARLN